MHSDNSTTVTRFFTEVGRALRYWPAVLISGIVVVIAGILALLLPLVTTLVIGILFGASILTQGILFAAVALSAKSGTAGRSWIGIWAVVSIILGILMLVYPYTVTLSLAYFLIAWFILSAINDFVRASSHSENRVWFALLGVLQLVLAIWLIFDIVLAVNTVVLLFAFGLLLRGFGEIALALRMRRIGTALSGK